MEIRAAQEYDLPECIELLKHHNLQYANGESPQEDYIGAFIGGNNFLIAKYNNKIIGLICGEPIKSNGFLLHYVIVSSGYSYLRVGEQLFESLSNKLKIDGCEFILGYASALDTKLLNFYERKYRCIIGKPMCEVVKMLI